MIPDNQYIENALKYGLPLGAERFFRTKFANASADHVSSVRGTLTQRQMLELKARVDEIVNGYINLTKDAIMTKEQIELSKVMYIYNYLLANIMYTQCQFDFNSGNVFGGNPYKNSVYGALVLHDAVCSGISEAFDCLCKVMDVQSTKLLSTPSDPWGGGHAFNSVKIGENWYKVDATLEIGINPGHKISAGKWQDRNFLVPFSAPLARVCVPAVANCNLTYPRETILQMQKRLSDRGLNFEYLPPAQIIHDNLHSALNSFLIKKIGYANEDIVQNFQKAIEGSFNIISINGVYVPQNTYIEEENLLLVANSDEEVELYSNGDSRFVIKSINRRQITGFKILKRTGKLECRLPISRWNPKGYNDLSSVVENTSGGRK